MESDPLGHILNALERSPGACATTLARQLGLNETTVSYHLRRHEKTGVVRSEMIGRTRCWFLATCRLCPVLRRALPAFRRPEAEALAKAADDTPRAIPALAATAGVPPGTARWLTGVLEEAFLLERTHMGRWRLREGAGRCVAMAAAGAPCDQWGKCEVSKAYRNQVVAGKP